jgi:DNA-binding CsgD family transcriptional regulator
MYLLANVPGKAQGRAAQSVAHCPPIAELGIAMPTSSNFGKRKSKTPAGRHAQPPQRPDHPATPRQTGLRVLPTTPWGTHICVFYESKQDLVDMHIDYFKAGLEANEHCVWAISDPITREVALGALRRAIPSFKHYLAEGRIDILPGYEWYLKGGEFDPKRITGGWSEKLSAALAMGRDGLRVSGNAFWLETNHWKEFREYEQELDDTLAGQRMIVMCTYALDAARAVDLLDVSRAHQFTIAKRDGEWEFLETPELRQAKEEIKILNRALGVLSKSFPGSAALTPRERSVLAQIVKGATSREAAAILSVSPRTIEFHRANIMQKVGVKNIAGLLRTVLSD